MSAEPSSKDSYQTRLDRFYETMKLSAALGQRSLAKRSRPSSDASSEVNTQRRFLNNLAFLCDHRRESSFKMSIAIESADGLSRFWIAADTEPRDNALRCLNFILSLLKRVLGLPERLLHHGEDLLQGVCADIAKSRLSLEVEDLSMAVKDCQPVLLKLNHPDLEDLPEWLGQLDLETNQDRNNLTWCRVAHEAQEYEAMEKLNSITGVSDMPVLTLPFVQLRHSIRCLARQIQACKDLIEDGAKLKGLLLTKFHVCMVTPPEPVPPPKLDPNTNFDVIARRLIETTPLRREIEAAFSRLKKNHPDIEERIKKQYGESMAVPRVPSEVQILEHFYKNRLKYSMGESFVGISKASCLCSQAYFRHHPAASVSPSTNGELCQSWSPSLIQGGEPDENFLLQHKLLEKVHSDIRQRVLQRILQVDQLGVPDGAFDEGAAGGKSADADHLGSDEHESKEDWLFVGDESDEEGGISV
ncbi:unnamed protein product [Clonostachys rhizophaga]|uniref:Uncharacterized protein n=1 Tax=Clonostachys rhizophaga TaxID=160324 RepID=A0A9N9VG93_9HYPO|nr:unnamed protein product [Clonostachys rhizophaga]